MDMNSTTNVSSSSNVSDVTSTGSRTISAGTGSALALLAMIAEVMQDANQKLAIMQTEVKGKMASAEFASMASTKQKANDAANASRDAAVWSMVAGIVGSVLTAGSAGGGFFAAGKVGEALGTAINGVGGGTGKLAETLFGIGASNADKDSKTAQADGAYLEKMTSLLGQYSQDNSNAAASHSRSIQEFNAKIADLMAQIIAASKVNT